MFLGVHLIEANPLVLRRGHAILQLERGQTHSRANQPLMFLHNNHWLEVVQLIIPPNDSRIDRVSAYQALKAYRYHHRDVRALLPRDTSEVPTKCGSVLIHPLTSYSTSWNDLLQRLQRRRRRRLKQRDWHSFSDVVHRPCQTKVRHPPSHPLGPHRRPPQLCNPTISTDLRTSTILLTPTEGPILTPKMIHSLNEVYLSSSQPWRSSRISRGT